MEVRELKLSDLQNGFVETLAALKKVELTESQLQDVFQKREQAGIKTAVVEKDGKIVGTATLLLEQKFINSGGIVGHIEDVAVHPEAQGLGIGRDLIESLIAHAEHAGCYKVILDCADDVIPFYEKLGFYKWEMAMRIDL